MDTLRSDLKSNSFMCKASKSDMLNLRERTNLYGPDKFERDVQLRNCYIYIDVCNDYGIVELHQPIRNI